MGGSSATPIGSLSWPLDPKELDERLWQISDIARVEYDTDEQAFEALQARIYDLRIEIARAATSA